MYLVTINVEKCQGCGDCVDTCPSELLAVVEESSQKHAVMKGSADDCLGCFACQEICEEGALTVTEM
jgi:ferredoxin